jgi:2-keto-myo-inositol isomerase
MTIEIPFALNHIAAPALDTAGFLDLASRLGCVGVELRNDLMDKQLSTRAFFDGLEPSRIGEMARERNLRLLGLSEAYGFNRWSKEMEAKIALLIEQADRSGAESISLIPLNDGSHGIKAERMAGLCNALSNVKEMLEGTSLVALVEPLGFTTSSLRRKAEAIEAIESVDGTSRFKLVHDTFHHHLAGETGFYPEQTGIVHISGVTDPGLKPSEMQDGHRILVDENDRLGNLAQIRALIDGGYKGAFSFEPFSPLVHGAVDPGKVIEASMAYIRDNL